jgi:hypothetical protein
MYETFKSTLTRAFDNEIWSSFKNGKIIKSNLNEKKQLEYEKLREDSEYLINDRLKIKTAFESINKFPNGYSIYRKTIKNRYIVILNLINNQIEIKRSI